MGIDVLVIDDDKAIRDILTNVLEDEGYAVRTGANSDEALSEFESNPPTVVVLDVWLNNSKLDGVEILTEMKSINENVPVIMISGHGTVDMAVSATKKGAYDFISKPFNTESLLSTISRAIDTMKLKNEYEELQSKLGIGEGEIIGKSKYAVKIKQDIEKYSKKNAVLIVGEVGTGKDIIANNIYNNIDEKVNLLKVDCNDYTANDFDKMITGNNSILKKGKDSLILIDNVNELENKSQKLLVKNITDKIKIIFVGQTKDGLDKSLLELVGKSVIETLPLNKRTDDIEELASELIVYRAKSKSKKPKTFDDGAIAVLIKHDWIGNVWELVNVLDNLLLNVKTSNITVEDVKKCLNLDTPKSKKDSNNVDMEDIFMLDLRKSREMFEKHYLTFHLKRFNGNITQTSEYVGMDRAALSRKIKSLDIKIDG